MLWPSLTSIALIGVERHPLPASVREQLMALGVEAAPDAPAEQVLMEALAAVRLLQQAASPLQAAPACLPEPAAPEERPLCSAEAARLLRAMLGGVYREALHEFLHLLHERGRRLPPDLLPELLDRAVRQPAEAAFLVEAAGPRGAWLAAQNPRWQVLLPAEAADWHTGTRAVRRLLLRTTRAHDAARARAWLEETWDTERAEDKAAFLEILADTLEPADEALLERARVDRARSVRMAALEQLARLPGSRALVEMQACYTRYLAPALTAKRAVPLEKLLPDRGDPVIEPWVDFLPSGGQAHWRESLLEFFIHYLPPAAHMEADRPEAFVQRLGARAEAAELLGALAHAVALHRADHWLAALWHYACARPDHAVWKNAGVARLLETYPAESAECVFASDWMRPELLPRFTAALQRARRPWPRALLRYVCSALEKAWGGSFFDVQHPPDWLLTIKTAAFFCRSADAEALYERFYAEFEPRPGPLQVFYDIVHFRQKMHKTL